MSNLCKKHKQEQNQSEFAEENCDICRLQAEVQQLKKNLGALRLGRDMLLVWETSTVRHAAEAVFGVIKGENKR